MRERRAKKASAIWQEFLRQKDAIYKTGLLHKISLHGRCMRGYLLCWLADRDRQKITEKI